MMSSKGKVNQLNQQHSSMLFLGSHIAVNSAELVDKHAESISDNECRMSLKMHFLHFLHQICVMSAISAAKDLTKI